MRVRLRTPAAGVLSGILFALAFPPFHGVVLLPVALVPWLAALAVEKSAGRALVSGVFFGLAYWCTSITWIVYVVTHYGGQSAAMGVLCLVLLALILAEWPAFVAWGTVAAFRPGSPWRMAIFPVLWMASEHARTIVYKGFPWNLTAHALYRHPVWLQTASVWGGYGVGFLVVASSALIAAAASRHAVRPLAAAAVIALGVGGFGAARLASGTRPKAEISVALLQPNLNEESRATPQGAAAGYRAVIGQAEEAAGALTGLIVIPESAFPVYWQESNALRQDLASIAHGGSRILFNDVEQEPGGRYFNAARLLGPEGLSGPAYRKVHLVPFGEYVPLPRIFFFVRQISTEIGAFSPASQPTLLRSGSLAIGTAICYETIYPSLAREETSRERTFSRRSRTTRGTAAPALSSSTSRERSSGRSRTSAISSGPRSPASRGSWMRGAASWPRRPPTSAPCCAAASASRRASRRGRGGDTGSLSPPTRRRPPC